MNRNEPTVSLNDKISGDITAAMKAKDAPRLSALRMLKAAIMNKGVEKARDLDDAEVLQVVASLVKQRRDSIEQFAKAGRTDLVDKETGEIAVLERTCRRRPRRRRSMPPSPRRSPRPAPLAKDMGKVMKAVMPKLAGKNADGRAVNEAVRRKLGA